MSEHVVDRLSAFLDDELEEAERRGVAGHLEACPSCTARLSELAALDQAARGLVVQAPDGYFEALPARIGRRLRAKRRPPLPVWGWAAAAALLIALVTPLLERDPFAPLKGPPPAPAPQARSPETPALPEASAPRAQEEGVQEPGKAQPARTLAPSAASPGRSGTGSGAVARDGAKAGEPTPQAAAGFAAPPAPAPAPATPAPASVEEELAAPREADRPAASAAAPGPAAGLSLAKERRKQAADPGRVDETKPSMTSRAGSRPPRSAEEARAIREEWRLRASRHPEGPEGDEAGLGMVEAGAQAYRLSGDPQDLLTLRHDAEAYLARGDARHAQRVRELLRSAEER